MFRAAPLASLPPLALLLAACAAQGDPPADPDPTPSDDVAVDLGPVTVRGLRPGETATLLAPAPPPAERALARGRVVDAFTAEPVAGATVELWSEEIDEHYGGFHRFGVATTGPDGRFAVTTREGGRRAEKLRVAAPGYLTYTEAAGNADGVVTLFPAEAEPPRLHLVDLQGRPIPGARVTSTYTCAHDVPALDVVSGADGVAVLEGWGLQDRVPELRVRAAGFRAVKYLDPDPVLLAAARGEPYTLRLPRTPGALFVLLDQGGEPIRDTPLHVRDGDGFHVVRTDEHGVVDIPSRYDDGELYVEILAPDAGPPAIGFVRTPTRSVLTPWRRDRSSRGFWDDMLTSYLDVLRVEGDDFPDGTATGEARLVLVGESAGPAPRGIPVSTRDGFVDETNEEGHIVLPEGDAFVDLDPLSRIGGTDEAPVFFLGTGRERANTMGSANGPTVRVPVDVPIEPGARTTVDVPCTTGVEVVELPAGLVSRVVVEYEASKWLSDESGSFELTFADNAPARVHVPGGREDGTVTASFQRSTLWFPEFEVVSGPHDEPLDESTTTALVRELEAARDARAAAHAQLGRRVVAVRVEGDVEFVVDSPVADALEVRREGDSATIEGPEGAPVLLRFSRDGRVDRWMRVRLGDTERVDVPDLPRLAGVRLGRGSEPFGPRFERGEGSNGQRDGLHPGPFHAVVESGAHRIGLALDLAPGDRRRIVIED